MVTDNHPRLHAAVGASCADPRATARSATTTDRCPGRTETRTLHVTTRLCPSLTPYVPVPQSGQVARLVRAVREKGQTRTETAALLTSLTPRRATPTRVLALIRGYGSVEVRHRLRDVTFGADHSRLRGGAAPRSGPPCALSPSPSSAARAKRPLPPTAVTSPPIRAKPSASYVPRPTRADNSRALALAPGPFHSRPRPLGEA